MYGDSKDFVLGFGSGIISEWRRAWSSSEEGKSPSSSGASYAMALRQAALHEHGAVAQNWQAGNPNAFMKVVGLDIFSKN